MIIDDNLIHYLAELSRIELTPDERDARKKDLTDILSYMDKLSELDTDGVREMTHPFVSANKFRDDVITNGDRREEMLANAPARKGDYFKVFKTVDD